MIGMKVHLPGATVAATTRWGGVSAAPYAELNLGGAVGDEPAAVHRNRELAAAELGLDPAAVVWMNQVHGADGAVVTERQLPGEAPRVDAIATDRPGLALAVLTADCTPLLLADAEAGPHGVLGAAHVGRPGLAAGVTATVVRLMTGLGARPERIRAVLGPGVCGRCYEVPEALRAEVAADTPAAWAETGWGTPALDIAAGVRAQLADLGVTLDPDVPPCTLESPDYFSYRRDRTTGRLASYVWSTR